MASSDGPPPSPDRAGPPLAWLDAGPSAPAPAPSETSTFALCAARPRSSICERAGESEGVGSRVIQPMLG